LSLKSAMSKRKLLVGSLCLILIYAIARCNLTYGSDYSRGVTEILAAEQSGARGLDLRIFDLRTLPPEIGRLTNLEFIAACCAHLWYLPPEIANLTQLKHLNLAENLLFELPPEIGQLSSLESLQLPRNQLRHLPSEIGNLTGLRYLILAHNNLTSLPPEIRQLTNLETLDLGDNPFDAPPEIIHQGSWAIWEYYGGQR
jgi:hypothetical protein